MHLETLKTFCDLVETGSFTQAAQLNFVSQSAVSQQLKVLEGRYHRTLLDRGTGRRVTPTQAGRLLYLECRVILDRMRDVEDRLRAAPEAVTGVVRLATVYSIGLHQLPPYVTRFMKAYPQVKVHIEYSRTNKVCDGCTRRLFDFGIVALPVRRSHLVSLPWRNERLVVVCAPTHRFAQRRHSVRLAQMMNEPFVAFERDIPTRKTVDQLLRAHGVRVKRVMQFDNIETIKRSVEVGTGVSILPESTVGHEIRTGQLVSRGIADGRFTRQIGVVHARKPELTGPAREFVRLLFGSPALAVGAGS